MYEWKYNVGDFVTESERGRSGKVTGRSHHSGYEGNDAYLVLFDTSSSATHREWYLETALAPAVTTHTHFVDPNKMVCGVCGETFDMRLLDSVLYHEHNERMAKPTFAVGTEQPAPFTADTLVDVCAREGCGHHKDFHGSGGSHLGGPRKSCQCCRVCEEYIPPTDTTQPTAPDMDELCKTCQHPAWKHHIPTVRGNVRHHVCHPGNCNCLGFVSKDSHNTPTCPESVEKTVTTQDPLCQNIKCGHPKSLHFVGQDLEVTRNLGNWCNGEKWRGETCHCRYFEDTPAVTNENIAMGPPIANGGLQTCSVVGSTIVCANPECKHPITCHVRGSDRNWCDGNGLIDPECKCREFIPEANNVSIVESVPADDLMVECMVCGHPRGNHGIRCGVEFCDQILLITSGTKVLCNCNRFFPPTIITQKEEMNKYNAWCKDHPAPTQTHCFDCKELLGADGFEIPSDSAIVLCPKCLKKLSCTSLCAMCLHDWNSHMISGCNGNRGSCDCQRSLYVEKL